MSQESSGGPGVCALVVSLRSGTIRDRMRERAAACDGPGSRPPRAAEPGRVNPGRVNPGRVNPGRVNTQLAVQQRLVPSRTPAERRMISSSL